MPDTPVTLQQMLDAREQRVLRQQALLYTGKPLLCFTLNIPGAVKSAPLIERTFDEGVGRIRALLARQGWPLLHVSEHRAATGPEGFFVVDADPAALKKAVVALEEASPLGRLFDMDTLRPDGVKIAREELGLPGRRCVLCSEPAQVCARSRAHSPDELHRHIHHIMDAHFRGQFADYVATHATRALLYELCVTPKPGLVDRADCGAHTDMDWTTFVDSAAALTPHFRDITLQALAFDGPDCALLTAIRPLGLAAEEAMLAATAGVNTHKGAVFSLGLVCAAAARLHRGEELLWPDHVCARCAAIAARVEGDLTATTTAVTNGEDIYLRYGITGSRGEAAGGFPSVRCHGLPVLRALLSDGASTNDAGVAALLSLLAHVEDTNIIARAGREAQLAIRERVAALLEQGRDLSALLDAADQFNREFIRDRVSPGGCADLLAVTYLLHFLCPAAPGEDAP